MDQNDISARIFIFATALSAVFFGSIAVALSWLG